MKYPKEKVDMLLVSLDDDQAEVRKVLAKDSIGWNLVTDSAGQAAMLVDLYNVSALPRCFLIDEEGKIIGCHMLGNPASELIVIAGIAINL